MRAIKQAEKRKNVGISTIFLYAKRARFPGPLLAFYEKYKDVIDPILSYLIENEKGIELNTGGLNNGLKDANPCKDIIKRYRELGGEIITIGSDSHIPDTLGSHFTKAAEILTDCGFKYYCVFANRIAEYLKI